MNPIMKRLLGHWRSNPGQASTWVHMNRLIKKDNLKMIYIPKKEIFQGEELRNMLSESLPGLSDPPPVRPS